MTPEKRNQMIQLVLGAVVALALLYFSVIGLLETRLEDQRKAVQTIRTQIETAKGQVLTASRNLQELESNQQRLRRMERLMPGSGFGGDAFLWMLNKLSPLMQRHGVQGPDVVQPQPTDVELPPAVPYGAANYALAGHARFKQIGLLLADFENQFPFARMSSLTLVATAPGFSSGETDPQLLSFRFDFVSLVVTNSVAR